MITSRPFQSGLRNLGGFHRFNPTHQGFGCCHAPPGYGSVDLSWMDEAIAATAAIATTSITTVNAAAQAKKDRAAAAKAARNAPAQTFQSYAPSSQTFQSASSGVPGWAIGLGAAVVVLGAGGLLLAFRKPTKLSGASAI